MAAFEIRGFTTFSADFPQTAVRSDFRPFSTFYLASGPNQAQPSARCSGHLFKEPYLDKPTRFLISLPVKAFNMT